ncbi:MAG: Trk system potassium transporter TrkA [Pseudomonadota bacterium]
MKIVIIGAGEVGFHIAGHLALENKNVTLIDTDAAALRRVSDHSDVQTIQGSGSSPETLLEAGIVEAEIMLAVTNSDEANLVACMMTDILSPTTKKLARLRGAAFDDYHEHFRTHSPHIDTVINPEIEVVNTIDRLMSVPGAVDVNEFADGKVKFVGVTLDQGSPLDGLRLIDLAQKLGSRRPLIAGMVRDEQVIIPRGKDHLKAGDIVYFIAEESTLMDTLSVFGKTAEPIRRVLIIGGGRIGFRLAMRLEETSVYTKIVETDAGRCAKLAEKLNRAVVLHGDGSDQALLAEENIAETDVVVTLTDDEETNILASLLASRMGARKTITKISKFSYFPLMSAIGLNQVVSPRLSAINSILQHVRRGKVLSAISIKGEQAEVLEAIAMDTSEIVSRPLKDIAFPKGVLVVAIIRQSEVIIPSGESIIQPDDRIIIFAHRQAISKLEKILAVKLEYF